jgi:protein-disulfide isomerase
MRLSGVPGAALAALGMWSVVFAAEPNPPKIDKPKLETYVRYAEAYTPEVQIAIDDPSPSPYKGFFRVLVHLSRGASRLDRTYYVTADGQHFVNGALWDLNESPFLDTLQHLPTNGFSFGPANAKVTMVIFSDLECPYCREFAKVVRDNIPQHYPNDVRVIFKDFPIESIHKWARAAAEAGECLGRQKPEAFWAFHDWVFEHQQEVNETNVAEKALNIAKEQNLDISKASSCIATHATSEDVAQSVRQGRILGIQQTPTFFINGRMVGGAVSWENLNSLIQMELHRPQAIPGPNTDKCCEVSIPTALKQH